MVSQSLSMSFDPLSQVVARNSWESEGISIALVNQSLDPSYRTFQHYGYAVFVQSQSNNRVRTDDEIDNRGDIIRATL